MSNTTLTPTSRFTGIFIPVEILEIQELTLFEMLLLSWIDALYCPKHGGCYASNHYLGEKLKNAQENTVAKALTKLRSLGLIENVSFDGRKRIIRACIGRHIEKAQSKAALDLNPIAIGQKSNPDMDKNPTPSYIYNKEENKHYNIPPNPQRGKATKVARVCDVSLISHGSHTKLKRSDYQAFCDKYGKSVIDELIQQINDYCASSRPKGYNCYAATIRNWINKKAIKPLIKLEESTIPEDDIDPVVKQVIENRKKNGEYEQF